jgi:hypothetical protein
MNDDEVPSRTRVRTLSCALGLVVEKQWEVSEAEEDSVVVKVGKHEWQIGFAGEDGPREREEHNWGTALHKDAVKIMDSFLTKHCDGEIPPNVLFVLPAHDYDTANPWASFAFKNLGFKNMLTTDARHMMPYSSGRRTAVVADLTAEKVECLALYDGFVIEEAIFSVDIPTGQTPNQYYTAVAQALVATLKKCPKDIMREFAENLFIAGTHFSSIGERENVCMKIMERVQAELPSNLVAKVMLPKEFKYSSWIGGSVLATLGVTQESWYSKEKWEKSAGTRGGEGQFAHMFGTPEPEGCPYWDVMKGKISALLPEEKAFTDRLGMSKEATAKEEKMLVARAEEAHVAIMKNAASKPDQPKPKQAFNAKPCQTGHCWLEHWGKTEGVGGPGAPPPMAKQLTSKPPPPPGGPPGRKAEENNPPEPRSKRGSLMKKGRMRKSWKLRYFEMDEDKVQYFAAEGGALKGQLECGPDVMVTIQIVQNSKWPNHFIVGTGARSLHLSAENPTVMNSWIDAFKRTVDSRQYPVPHGAISEEVQAASRGGGGGGVLTRLSRGMSASMERVRGRSKSKFNLDLPEAPPGAPPGPPPPPPGPPPIIDNGEEDEDEEEEMQPRVPIKERLVAKPKHLISADEMSELISSLDEEEYGKADRLLTLEEAPQLFFFNCAQLKEVLGSIGIKAERMVATVSIAPSIKNPDKYAIIMDLFRFSTEKEQVKSIFNALINKNNLKQINKTGAAPGESKAGMRAGRGRGRGRGKTNARSSARNTMA